MFKSTHTKPSSSRVCVLFYSPSLPNNTPNPRVDDFYTTSPILLRVILTCHIVAAAYITAHARYNPPYPTPAAAKNVLFIAVDDMRPSLGAYNFTLPGQPTHSPNLDKLASEGTVFTHAYVQYAYCSPSRNSFMTGT